MRINEMLGKQPLFFDGGMGTLLQKAGLPMGMAPDLANLHMPGQVKAIHRDYLAAGCHIIKTNTFGGNELKLKGSGHTVPEIVRAAVGLAREAIAEAEASGVRGPHFVAMDIGPSGKLLAPLGDLDFDEALAVFAQAAQAGADAGVDCVLVETMSDAYELKAAVLAAKATGLPVFATVTVDENGKLLTGADMEAVTALLEGLRVDALGLNCGLGPRAMRPFMQTLRQAASVPLIISPNAGLPRQVGDIAVFDETPEAFAAELASAASLGAHVFGGCCGTTPAHIAAMIEAVSRAAFSPPQEKERTVVSSGSRAVLINGFDPVLIGERINPTGKPAMKRALREGRMEPMLREAVRQQEAGVHLLDVNAGLPGIDEATWLAKLVPAIQGVSDLPLQLDTANPEALETAMRRYNGKPMVNSVNGKAESMAAVFPLIRRYGGVVVVLTLDENGIPDSGYERFRLAERIIQEAAAYGIPKKDIVVDPLTMAISADPQAAENTLEALRLLTMDLHVKTVLGISNISFGLPKRSLLNTAFYTMALSAGLSCAIVNPFSEELMQANYAMRALKGLDPSCSGYIAALGGEPEEAKSAPQSGAMESLSQAILHGLKEDARRIAKALLAQRAPMEIVEAELIPALNAVGNDFGRGKVFLPQLLMSAEAAKAAFEALGEALGAAERRGRGTVVIATVLGDIHDIGKNIAKAMLENYRFDVIDLGRDVPPERVVEAAAASGAKLVGLSALMTTTVVYMEKTIRQLREALPGVRIMVGGAVLSEDYAKQIGADAYVRDAMDSVRYAEAVYPSDGAIS